MASERRIFTAAAILLTVLATLPTLIAPYPPLQDWPQHLFGAHVLEELGRPDSPLAASYEARLVPGPYAGLFVTLRLLSKLVSLELAGRCVLAFGPLLLLAFVLGEGSAGPRATRQPWGSLLLIPLSIGPCWFLGFVSFGISMSLLLLALRGHVGLLDHPGKARSVSHAIVLLALVAAHPFSAMAYAGLGLSGWLLFRRERGAVRWNDPALCFPTVLGILTAVWMRWGASQSALSEPPSSTLWIPPRASLEFSGIQFTGLHWPPAGTGLLTLALWLAAAAIVLTWPRGRMPSRHETLRFLLYASLCFAALLAMPFRQDGYTYVNLRCGAILALLLGAFAARIELGRARAAGLVLVVSLLCGDLARKQQRLAGDLAEFEGIRRVAAPGAELLPVLFDNDSAELDPTYFDPHLHTHLYYHLRGGGGIGSFVPYVFDTPVNPVRPRPEARLPSPGEYAPRRFRPEVHGRFYRYWALRGAPEALEATFSEHAVLRARSGAWALWELRNAPAPVPSRAIRTALPRAARVRRRRERPVPPPVRGAADPHG